MHYIHILVFIHAWYHAHSFKVNNISTFTWHVAWIHFGFMSQCIMHNIHPIVFFMPPCIVHTIHTPTCMCIGSFQICSILHFHVTLHNIKHASTPHLEKKIQYNKFKINCFPFFVNKFIESCERWKKKEGEKINYSLVKSVSWIFFFNEKWHAF